MPQISRSALLPYSSEQVYTLINDISAYPEFMDGCVGAEILSREDNVMLARLDLAKAGFTYSVTTRNELVPPNSVDMQLVDGPFKAFSGQWTVQPLGDSACKVTLKLDFDLASRALALAARALFNPMADNLVDVVVRRAKQLYG